MSEPSGISARCPAWWPPRTGDVIDDKESRRYVALTPDVLVRWRPDEGARSPVEVTVVENLAPGYVAELGLVQRAENNVIDEVS